MKEREGKGRVGKGCCECQVLDVCPLLADGITMGLKDKGWVQGGAEGFRGGQGRRRKDRIDKQQGHVV